jgi:hypothetical protein
MNFDHWTRFCRCSTLAQRNGLNACERVHRPCSRAYALSHAAASSSGGNSRSVQQNSTRVTTCLAHPCDKAVGIRKASSLYTYLAQVGRDNTWNKSDGMVQNLHTCVGTVFPPGDFPKKKKAGCQYRTSQVRTCRIVSTQHCNWVLSYLWLLYVPWNS